MLTADGRKALPALRANEGLEDPDDAICVVKFFSPYSDWTWYATEGAPVIDEGQEVDFEFFGLVCGFEKEWGYFVLSELEGATKMNGRLPLVERDCYWTPTSIRELKAKGVIRP